MKKNILEYSAIFAIAVAIVSCGGNKRNNNQDIPSDSTSETVKEEVKQTPKRNSIELRKTYTFTIKDAGFKFDYFDMTDNYSRNWSYIKKIPGTSLTSDWTFYEDGTVKIELTQKTSQTERTTGPRNFKVTLIAGGIHNPKFDTYSEFGEEYKALELPSNDGLRTVEPVVYYTDSSFSVIDEREENSQFIDLVFEFEDFKFQLSPGLYLDEDFNVYGDLKTLQHKTNPLGKFKEKEK